MWSGPKNKISYWLGIEEYLRSGREQNQLKGESNIWAIIDIV